jgi:hypothetical protein
MPGQPALALYLWGSNSRAESVRARRLGWKPHEPSFWEALEDVSVAVAKLRDAPSRSGAVTYQVVESKVFCFLLLFSSTKPIFLTTWFSRITLEISDFGVQSGTDQLSPSHGSPGGQILFLQVKAFYRVRRRLCIDGP